MNTTQYSSDDDVTDEVSSPYLKGIDVPKSGMTLTIKIVSQESFPNAPGEQKRVVLFYETKKRLVANKTQLSTLASLFGPHPSEWRSKVVLLEPLNVMFNGKPAVSIQISAAPSPVATTQAQDGPDQSPATEVDIPF